MAERAERARIVTRHDNGKGREWQVRMSTWQLAITLFITSVTAMGMLTAGALTLLRPVVSGWVQEEIKPLKDTITELPGVYYTRREFETHENEQIFRMNSIANSVNKIEGRVEWLYQQEIQRPQRER